MCLEGILEAFEPYHWSIGSESNGPDRDAIVQDGPKIKILLYRTHGIASVVVDKE